MRSTSVTFATLFLVATGAIALADPPEANIRAGHNLLEEAHQRAAIAPGEQVPQLAFHDLGGEVHYLDEQLEKGPAVFLFTSTQCPLAKRYTERLKRLYEAHADQGVEMYLVFPNGDETVDGIREYCAAAEFKFPVVRDVNAYLARRLGATMTPQAFLIDKQSVLRYRGAIDDNRYEPRVKEGYLASALTAVLADQPVEVATTQALGCSIHADAGEADGPITYTRHVARLLQDNCQSCHRPGQVAPFSLTNYDEASTWATEIKAYVAKRLMPPWKAAPGFGDFKNDVSLTDAEIALISAWVDGGAPQGNPEDMPPAPKYNEGWVFGEPDLVVEMPEEYVVGPEGEDDYRHFVIPYEADGPRFVEALDVRPGNHSVVHHVIAYVDTSGKARELDAADPGPGYSRFGDVGFQPASFLGGWAPGNFPLKMPPATGRWLPPKCDIVLQVHYYRTGVEERDRTKIGAYFSKAPRPVPSRVGVVINQKFNIRAGEANEIVEAQKEIKEPSYLYSVTPHMHLIGETMKVTAHLPDGTVMPVVKIDDWDFNWQTTYHFRDLHLLPAGTIVKLVATFDNSAANPNNPNNPPKDIGWGERTTDEMCIAFLGLIHAKEYDPEKQARRTEPLAGK